MQETSAACCCALKVLWEQALNSCFSFSFDFSKPVSFFQCSCCLFVRHLSFFHLFFFFLCFLEETSNNNNHGSGAPGGLKIGIAYQIPWLRGEEKVTHKQSAVGTKWRRHHKQHHQCQSTFTSTSEATSKGWPKGQSKGRPIGRP